MRTMTKKHDDMWWKLIKNNDEIMNNYENMMTCDETNKRQWQNNEQLYMWIYIYENHDEIWWKFVQNIHQIEFSSFPVHQSGKLFYLPVPWVVPWVSPLKNGICWILKNENHGIYLKWWQSSKDPDGLLAELLGNSHLEKRTPRTDFGPKQWDFWDFDPAGEAI